MFNVDTGELPITFSFLCAVCKQSIPHSRLVKMDYKIDEKIKSILERSKIYADYYINGIYKP